MRLVKILLGFVDPNLAETNEQDDFIISNISPATSATDLASNPKSFFNCPDLHGGVSGLPGGKFRSRETQLLGGSKYRALQRFKRPRAANIHEEKRFSAAIDNLEGTKKLILAAIRVWEMKRGHPHLVRSTVIN